MASIGDSKKTKLGVLVSGGGTNLQAVIDACGSGSLPAEVAVVVGNKKDAYALTRAEQSGIPEYWVNPADYPDATAYDQAVLEKLRAHRVDLVVLAGYMKLVGGPILDAYPLAVINLHPALLPAFAGAHAIRDALDYGVRVTGVTVHFADGTFDSGPIIIQEIVPVHQDDTEETLAARVHQAEHQLLPRAIKLWCEGRLKVEGRHVRVLARESVRRS